MAASLLARRLAALGVTVPVGSAGLYRAGDPPYPALLGYSLEDDVPDPVGGPLRGYADTAAVLDRLVARLAELGWAHAR